MLFRRAADPGRVCQSDAFVHPGGEPLRRDQVIFLADTEAVLVKVWTKIRKAVKENGVQPRSGRTNQASTDGRVFLESTRQAWRSLAGALMRPLRCGRYGDEITDGRGSGPVVS